MVGGCLKLVATIFDSPMSLWLLVVLFCDFALGSLFLFWSRHLLQNPGGFQLFSQL